MKIQSKQGSFIEACVNTAIGFLISLVANPLFCWLFHVKMSAMQMTGYVASFTVLSVIRGYVIRRWFNHSVEHAVNKWLQKKIPDGYQSLQPEIDELSKPLDYGGYQLIHELINKIPPGQSEIGKVSHIQMPNPLSEKEKQDFINMWNQITKQTYPDVDISDNNSVDTNMFGTEDNTYFRRKRLANFLTTKKK